MEIGEPVGIALIGAVAVAAVPPLPTFRVHLDADRDGRVDDNWRGLGTWAWGRGKRGAICLCNADDDDGRNSQDHTDGTINGGNDKKEIAPLDIRKHGSPSAPGSWTGFLSVSPEDAKRIRIFDSRTGGGSEIVGPAAGDTYTFPNLSFTKKEFGIEARYFAGEVGARSPAPISHNFDGSVLITFRIEDGGTEIYKQVAQIRVAPWVMMHHLDRPLTVYVVDAGADRRLPDGRRVGNSGFRSELATAAGSAPVEHGSWDVWMQDCMEIGFTSAPKIDLPVAMPARRDRDLETYPETLLAANYGYQRTVPMPPDPDDEFDGVSTFDSTGNLEVTPPCKVAGKKYPLGRIYYGGVARGAPEDFDVDVRVFLESQLVQSPFSIDTSWLAVGHVDEVVSFVKGNGAQGFKMLVASWRRARKILDRQQRRNPTAKMLVGREMPWRDFRRRRFGGYHNIEVTVGDFLTSGIPALGPRGAGLIAFNDTVQGKIDSIAAAFKAATGVKNRDIIEVPTVYFPNDHDPAMADALTGGMVNTLVLNQTCIMAKAFGPQTRAGDLFQNYVRRQLRAAGATAKFVDDWYPYHVMQGEVHCGTNTLRKPGMKKWWEVKP